MEARDRHGDWEDDSSYPRAPLPPHERTWRHPSELGAEQWAATEPPLVVGRGLSIATGAVGAALAIGLLWLIVPHSGRGSSTAATTAAPVATTATSAVTAAAADSAAFTSDAAPATTWMVAAPSTEASTTVALSVAGDMPMPTMVLERDESHTPVAVALLPGRFVVTTAAAVRGREGFDVRLPTGHRATAAVITVDQARGTAVLALNSPVDDAMIDASTAAIQSGTFTVMAPDSAAADVWFDTADDGTSIAAAGTGPGEGSPVVDAHGALIGLCTSDAGTTYLITVDRLLDALHDAGTLQTPPWMGIEVDLDSAGSVVVTSVRAGGPGEAAGVRVGDVVVAVDGTVLGDLETLRTIVASSAAGDSIALTLQRPSESVPVASTTTTAAATTTVSGVGATIAASSVPAPPALTTTTRPAPTTVVAETSVVVTSSLPTTEPIVPFATIEATLTLMAAPG